jgi:hypothetical protein
MVPFGRQVILEFGLPGQQGRRFRDLSVTFRVEMTQTATPNTARIVARNLAADSVALLQRDGVVVRLLAGYDAPRLVFQGEPVRNGVDERYEGTDRVLTLDLQDGGRSYRLGRVSVSYATATTLGQVLDAVTDQLGLPLGTIDVDRTVGLGRGIVLRGPARDVLDQIAEASDARWSIIDGALNIIARTGSLADQAVVFSAARGNLIGSPSRKDGGVEVKGLIAPSLRPGKLFRVESAFITGDYVATEVDFMGGLREQDFYVVARGRPRRSV